MQKDPKTLKSELKSYNERELCFFGIFLYSDRLLKLPNDKNNLETLSLLASRSFEVLDSVENTFGFHIDLDDCKINEMDFNELTKTIMNCGLL